MKNKDKAFRLKRTRELKINSKMSNLKITKFMAKILR